MVDFPIFINFCALVGEDKEIIIDKINTNFYTMIKVKYMSYDNFITINSRDFEFRTRDIFSRNNSSDKRYIRFDEFKHKYL